MRKCAILSVNTLSCFLYDLTCVYVCFNVLFIYAFYAFIRLSYAFICFLYAFIRFIYAFICFLYAFIQTLLPCLYMLFIRFLYAKKQNVPSSSLNVPRTQGNVRLSRCAAGKKWVYVIYQSKYSVYYSVFAFRQIRILLSRGNSEKTFHLSKPFT